MKRHTNYGGREAEAAENGGVVPDDKVPVMHCKVQLQEQDIYNNCEAKSSEQAEKLEEKKVSGIACLILSS